MDLFARDSYRFDLPPELIAKQPAEPRDSSRLIVLRRETQTIEHRRFSDLPELLGPNDVLVANNSKVMKARLLGHRIAEDGSSAGKIEFLMLELRKDLGPHVWEGLFKSAARSKPGLQFRIAGPRGDLVGTIVQSSYQSETGTVVAEFDSDPLTSGAGELPLPPYMERKPESSDESRYQTVYAKSEGSAAAPTAGLHFTPRVREALAAKGVGWEELTLHVGIGTFRPVKTDDVRKHPMHEEQFELPERTAARLFAAKSVGKRIIAVGTTTVRSLESAWDSACWQPGVQRTSIFIYPGGENQVRSVDGLLTNFHLPESTLLMLVCAFGGYELVMRAYREAVAERYRFFSYGDAMLIL